MIHSVLDLFILSLLDRGLQTPYDLQRRGGLSLGSAIPALARLEGAGLVRKRDVVGASKRPRHGYKVSAAGLKLARSGWIALLKDPSPSDLDAVLRVISVARRPPSNAYGDNGKRAFDYDDEALALPITSTCQTTGEVTADSSEYEAEPDLQV